MKVGDIFVALGFDVDGNALKGFDEGIGQLNAKMVATATATAAAVYQIGAFVEKAIRGSAVLRDFNLQTGESANELQKWQIAVPLADINSSAEIATASIKNLQKSIYDVRWGSGSPQAFNLLGIDVMHGQNAFDALEQLRDRLQENIATFGRTKTVQLMGQMGLDPSFINTLALTREQFAALYKGRILDQKELDKLNEAGFAIKKLSTAWEYFTAHLSAEMSPAIVHAIDIMLPHIENIFRGLERIGHWIEANISTIESLAVAFSPFIVMLNPWKTGLAAILFLMDKIGSYKPGDGGFIDWVLKSLEKIRDILRPITDGMSKLVAWGLWKAADGIDAMNKDGSTKQLGEGIRALTDALKASNEWMQSHSTSPVTGGAMGGALGPMSKHMTVHKSQTNTIHVNGATDPHATATAIQEGLRVQNSGAESFYNNGGW